jgi:hypothetical protein
MKILIHYPIILNLFNKYGSQLPPDELNYRLWEELKNNDNDLKIYISPRGFDIVERDIADSSKKAFKKLHKIWEKIETVPESYRQPYLGQEQKREDHRGSWEEEQEVRSAKLANIPYILSKYTDRFHSFGLKEIDLDKEKDIDKTIDKIICSEKSNLPTLLKGDFQDIFFIGNALKRRNGNVRKFEQSRRIVNLSSWFEGNRLTENWDSLERFSIGSYSESRSRFRRVTKVKVLNLEIPGKQNKNSIFLIISVANPLREFSITMEVLPKNKSSVLPYPMSCKIIDSLGECVKYEKTSYNTPNIAMEIEGQKGEYFSVVFEYMGVTYKENFII